jgi:hypothetical protein
MGTQQTHHLYNLHSCMYPCKQREGPLLWAQTLKCRFLGFLGISHCSQFQCHRETWETNKTNKPIIYIAFIHVCNPCKQREDHCHGPQHLRLLLLNANILDSLKCFIVFNFNVVEKDGTLIKFKSCKQKGGPLSWAQTL